MMLESDKHTIGDRSFAVSRCHLHTTVKTGGHLHIQPFRGFRRDFREDLVLRFLAPAS